MRVCFSRTEIEFSASNTNAEEIIFSGQNKAGNQTEYHFPALFQE